MQDVLGLVGSLNRPRLLVRAARFGVDEYNRSAHLPRLLQCDTLPRSGEAILRLLEVEAELDERRLAAPGHYPVARHVEVLTALLGEVRLVRACTLALAG